MKMKINLRTAAGVAALVALLGGAIVITSYAQDKSAEGKSTDDMPACCKQMMQTMQKGGMNMNMTNMMSGMMKGMPMMQGMTPDVMARMQLLMRTPIAVDGPSALSAQAEKLGLTEKQTAQLGKIENEARAKARAVLTPDQLAKLGNVPDQPVTMMETCPMMKMMQGMQPGQKDETEKTK